LLSIYVSATHPRRTARRARRILCFAKSPSGFGINDIAAVVSTSVLALKLTDERLATEIHQQQMMFEVKPAAGSKRPCRLDEMPGQIR
jgi:hypothetical protein